MNYRHLGSTGVRISEVALGTGGQFGLQGEDATRAIVDAALDAGINYIDTANIYPVTDTPPRGELSELMVGAALRGRRHQIVLGTKGMQATGPGINERGASRYNLMNALEASLRRLQTDHVDLYQVHLPDPETPDEETMRTLEDMVRSGKVRYVGASQYMAWRLCRCNAIAERYGWARFDTVQMEYNLISREVEREMIPFCRASGVGLLAYFPFANGLLAGRYRPGELVPADSRAARFQRVRNQLSRFNTPAGVNMIERLTAFARERDRTLAELAVAWVLAEPSVSTVLCGASKPEQIAASARASDWRLSPEELAEVDAAVQSD